MRLGHVLADYRYAQRIGVRDLAKEIGISSATLNRVENEGACDGATLIKILSWLFAAGDSRKQKK